MQTNQPVHNVQLNAKFAMIHLIFAFLATLHHSINICMSAQLQIRRHVWLSVLQHILWVGIPLIRYVSNVKLIAQLVKTA